MAELEESYHRSKIKFVHVRRNLNINQISKYYFWQDIASLGGAGLLEECLILATVDREWRSGDFGRSAIYGILE